MEAGLCAAVLIRCAPCLFLFPCQRCPLFYGFLRAGAQSVRGVQSYDIPQGKRTDQRSGILAGSSYGGAVPGRAGALRVQVPADSGRGHGRIYLYFHERHLQPGLCGRADGLYDSGLSALNCYAQPQCGIPERHF